MRHVALVLTFALAIVRPSFGATIFTDNFESSLPASVLNANVPGWVALNGTVDYLKNYGGLPCRGAACIDLDGSTSNAADFESATTFNLLAGNVYTLTYWFSGNSRGGLDSMTVSFGGLTNTHTNIPFNAPFTQFSIVVAPLVDTTSTILFSHAGGDNVGLLLDDVSLDGSLPAPVPEPSLLLLLGAGLLGGVRRLRTRARTTQAG